MFGRDLFTIMNIKISWPLKKMKQNTRKISPQKNIIQNCGPHNKNKILAVDKISLMEMDQNNKLIMTLALPGVKAPEFSGMTTGPKGHNEMSLKDFTLNGSWCLLFFLPKAKDELSSNEIEGAREELSSLNLIKKDLDDLKCNLLVCTEAKDTTNN